MTPRQKARHILNAIIPRPVCPDEIKVFDLLTDTIEQYEREVAAWRRAHPGEMYVAEVDAIN